MHLIHGRVALPPPRTLPVVVPPESSRLSLWCRTMCLDSLSLCHIFLGPSHDRHSHLFRSLNQSSHTIYLLQCQDPVPIPCSGQRTLIVSLGPPARETSGTIRSSMGASPELLPQNWSIFEVHVFVQPRHNATPNAFLLSCRIDPASFGAEWRTCDCVEKV